MDAITGDTLRIIDANINRIGEGLRFLEELARLRLNNTELTQKLKNIRHEIVRVDVKLQKRLLLARDSEQDIGVNMEVPGEGKLRDVSASLVANARRAQESLRVMEEMARIPGLGLDTDKYRQARFDLYTIEKKLIAGVLRQDRIKGLSGLYVIIDTQALLGRDHIEVTRQAISGGARVIQLRDKTHRRKELLAIAEKLSNLCHKQNILFIINDYLDIALAADADGLHIGEDDLPTVVARRILPPDKILGCSVRTIENASAAQSEGADYIAVGAMYPTSSREEAEVVGPERLKLIKRAVVVPVVAIGGINEDNISPVLAAGADSIAVISAVLGADNVEQATRRLVGKLEGEWIG